MSAAELDHLGIATVDRALIAAACRDAERIYLQPLDKGLSGSLVWRARWKSRGIMTKDHVLKVGPLHKIEREYRNYSDIAAAIDKSSPHMTWERDEAAGRGVLRQELVGDERGVYRSLRAALTSVGEPDEAEALIDRLYRTRMSAWHYADASFTTETAKLSEALDWWTRRVDLPGTVAMVGTDGVESSLSGCLACTFHETAAAVMALLEVEEEISVGPVHADLHAQNVLVDEAGQLHLIDFGWTNYKWRAVDFLMMECSLKFLVSPAHARLEDLLCIERQLEPTLAGEDVDLAPLRRLIYGAQLSNVAAATASVRRNAFESGAVTGPEQYRRGLVALTAGLASIKNDDFNRVFLLHSLAFHAREAAQGL